jgi:hypothetical protein
MLNFGDGGVLLPDSDGSIDVEDRAFLLGLYMGISLSTAATPTMPGLEFTLLANRPHAVMPENRLHYTLPVNRPHFVMEEED